MATKLDTSQNDLEKLDELTAIFQKMYIKVDLIGPKSISYLFMKSLSICVLGSSSNH